MKDVPEIDESPEKDITKTSERKFETFDDLRTSDKSGQIETFDDIARGKGAQAPIESFDDIAKSKEGKTHYEEAENIEKKPLTPDTPDDIEQTRPGHLKEKYGNHDKDIKDEREKRSEIVEEMVSKDFPVTPEKRSDNTKDFHFADETEFARELRNRDPLATQKDVNLTKGFHDSRDGLAFVKEDGDTLVTSLHENLHQKSKSELPTRLNEGITEHFARREAGAVGELKEIDAQGRQIPKGRSDYEKEVEIVGKLEATVGEKPLQRAYFEGKSEVLKNHIDSILGDDAFRKLSDALEEKDYETASKIIDRK